MTTRRLIFHPGVEHDLDQILGYYRERDPALPARYRAKLTAYLAPPVPFPGGLPRR